MFSLLTSASSQNDDHKRCAQEVLDGVRDYTCEIARLTQNLNYSSPTDGVSGNSRAYQSSVHPETLVAKVISAPPGSSIENPIKENHLANGLELFSQETADREALAISKTTGTGVVGGLVMTVSEMEHRRKLTPLLISFCSRYLEILGQAEQEEADLLAATKTSGEAMAKEAIASLGSSKGASDAATFVKTLQGSHQRDNQYKLVAFPNSREKIERLLSESEDLLAELDAARTNANASVMEPFEMPKPFGIPSDDEPRKSVQSILCESSPGPASIYAKLEKITNSLCTSGTPSSSSKSVTNLVIAGVEGPGLRKVTLASKNPADQFVGLFQNLIRYKKALDRLNLDVSFKGGDGTIYRMQSELIRCDIQHRLDGFLGSVKIQLDKASSYVTRNNNQIEEKIDSDMKSLQAKHEKENRDITLSNRRNIPLDEPENDRVSREQLEAAHTQIRLQRQKREMDELASVSEKYRNDHFVHMVTVPDLDTGIKSLMDKSAANKKVNQRRRAPANAQRWVSCAELASI